MSSQKQIAANRQNAQKSTGPKTEEGKETVSQNAIKHGLTARQDVIGTESQEFYDFRRDQMLADLAPTGPIEAMLAERIVSLSWRLDRSVTIQTQVIDTLLEDFERVHKEAVKDYDPYYPSRQNPDLKLGGAARNDIRDNKVLDRLLMYERRIERSLYKTMAELKNLQQTRKRNQPRTTEEDSTIQQSKEFILDTDPGPQRLGKEPTRTHITETSHTQEQMQNAQNKANLPEPKNVTTSVITREYDDISRACGPENKPNRTQSEAFELDNTPNTHESADSTVPNRAHAATVS